MQMTPAMVTAFLGGLLMWGVTGRQLAAFGMILGAAVPILLEKAALAIWGDE